MATSNSTDFNLNGGQIVTAALRKLRVLGGGESATADQMTDGLQALNLMVKSLQARGIHLWRRTEGSLALTADTQSYTFGSGGDFTTRALRIEDMRSQKTGEAEIPMWLLSRDEYFDLPNKDTTGTPTQFYYDPQLTTAKLYIWPVPNATGTTLKFTYARQFEDFDEQAHDPDFPQEWLNLLVYGLALEMAPEYSKEVPQLVAAQAERLLREVEGFDRELATIRFGVR